jgi:hypothetical protein
MDQRQLVAVVVTADGKRVPVRLSDENPAASFIERLLHQLRRLFDR